MTATHSTPPPQGGVSLLSGSDRRFSIPQRGAVVLSTLGSLGDLYPVLSVARALAEQGVETRLALSPDDARVAESWGLLATPIGPSQAAVCDRLGVTRDDIAASVLRDPRPMLRDVLIPMLPALVETLRPLLTGAGLVSATPFALAASLAAEEAALPFIPLRLQPMMSLSALDPPRRHWSGLAPARPGSPGHLWNRMTLGLIHWMFRRSLASPYNAVRAQMGLPFVRTTPLLDPDTPPPLTLGLWDSLFCPQPNDSETTPVGFPPPAQGALDIDTQRWIEAGPPPLVITLGSIAQGLGGAAFWENAAQMARAMNLRALLLHGTAPVPEGPNLRALPYAPHADVFPKAAAIIHHGGIGTSAEALRSGKPQLVVPIGGDQPDNAARLVDLGVAAVLPLKRFTATRAQAGLGDLLERFDYSAAGQLAQNIAETDGAKVAASHLIASMLRQA